LIVIPAAAIALDRRPGRRNRADGPGPNFREIRQISDFRSLIRDIPLMAAPENRYNRASMRQ